MCLLPNFLLVVPANFSGTLELKSVLPENSFGIDEPCRAKALKARRDSFVNH